MPALVQRDQNQSRVEDGDVAEKAEWIVLAGREQNWCKEAAQHAENGDHQRIKPHGEQKRRDGDERHQKKGWNRPEKFEVINRAAGKRDGIKNNDAGRTQGLRKRGKFFARHEYTAHDQSESGQETYGHAELRRDKIVVERIFDEERDAQKE